MSVDWNAVLFFAADPSVSSSLGVGAEFVGKRRHLILRPQFVLAAKEWIQEGLPFGSLSLLFVL